MNILVRRKHQVIVNDFLTKLIKDRNIFSILFVGSIVNSTLNYNDIDILLLVKNVTRMKYRLVNLHMPYLISDDTYRFKVDNKTEISFSIQNHTKFLKRINQIINGKNIDIVNKSWAIGGFFPEILLNDVRNSVIIKDRFSKIEAIKQQLNLYPVKLKNTIIKMTMEEITQKNRLYRNPNLSKTIKSILSVELFIAITRLYFTRRNEYFPGFKRFTLNKRAFKDFLLFIKKVFPQSEKIIKNLFL